VNDGSTDNSSIILEEYARKDSRIIVLNQENKGQATARNVGLKISRGKYVSFVDSDDWIDAKMFEISISLLEDDIDAVVFYPRLFGEEDKSLQKYFRPHFQGKQDLNGDVIFATPIPPWSKIYRRDIIDNYEISFPDGLLYEDNSFHWKYLMQARRAYFCSEELYNYRIRKDSIMSRTKSSLLKVTDHFWVCLDVFKYMKKYRLVEEYSESFVRFFEHCMGIVCSYSTDLQKSMEIAHEVWSRIDIATNNDIICALKCKNYDYVIEWIGYSSLEKAFSIKKRYGKKNIAICGIKF
jgi:glycosyltransferase involved in cell wall biosynthesis